MDNRSSPGIGNRETPGPTCREAFLDVKLPVPMWDVTLYITRMSLFEIQHHVVEWSRMGEPWAEAALVGVRRSAPRPPGARFAVGKDGSATGSISAGCVEADLREHMLAALGSSPRAEPRIVTYGISDEAALGVGLACGGEIDVLIRCHEQASRYGNACPHCSRGPRPGGLVARCSPACRPGSWACSVSCRATKIP